jgi:hypothetical protein
MFKMHGLQKSRAEIMRDISKCGKRIRRLNDEYVQYYDLLRNDPSMIVHFVQTVNEINRLTQIYNDYLAELDTMS